MAAAVSAREAATTRARPARAWARWWRAASRGSWMAAATADLTGGAPWRSRKTTIANRSSVLGALVDAGAELILSGHVHQSAVGERREFEVVAGPDVVPTVDGRLGALAQVAAQGRLRTRVD